MVRKVRRYNNMEAKRESWSSLEVKTKIAYITAIVAFFLGWALTIAGFIIGAGIISDSVLWVLGQSLVYAASVFGVGMYVTTSVRGMKTAIRHFMADEDRKFRNNDYMAERNDFGDTTVEDIGDGDTAEDN